MPILVALVAAAAGALDTVQAGANASLTKALGQPILAALIVAGTNAVLYLLAEHLGAALFTGITVTDAIVAPVALDHYGALGFAQHGARPWRILGGLMVIGGVALIALF